MINYTVRWSLWHHSVCLLSNVKKKKTPYFVAFANTLKLEFSCHIITIVIFFIWRKSNFYNINILLYLSLPFVLLFSSFWWNYNFSLFFFLFYLFSVFSLFFFFPVLSHFSFWFSFYALFLFSLVYQSAFLKRQTDRNNLGKIEKRIFFIFLLTLFSLSPFLDELSFFLSFFSSFLPFCFSLVFPLIFLNPVVFLLDFIIHTWKICTFWIQTKLAI